MSEFEQKYTFSGVGVFEVTIPFPYASPSEVTVFYSGDAGIYEGTLAGLIQSGIATRVEGATYRLHFDEGQTVHTVFGRRTILKAEIQTLLRAVEDLRAEMLGAFRVPDACFEMLKTFPAKLRAKKAVLMDCCGQLSVGDFPGTAEIDAAKQQVEDAANRSSLLLNEATERLESAISAYRKIESLCNAFPREAEAANAKLQEVVGGALSEFRRVVNNAEALFGQQSEQAVSRLSAEVEKYSAFAEKQRELFAVALESAVKCLNEASDSGIDSIEDREDEALRALDAELEHALTVIRECIRAYGLKLRELTDKLISELRSCYSEEWAKSAQKYALDAQASAEKAKASEDSAEDSASRAASSESSASDSARDAEASADAALKSENAASASESNAKASEEAAKASEIAAKTSESLADASAKSAAASASEAAVDAEHASTSASEAERTYQTFLSELEAWRRQAETLEAEALRQSISEESSARESADAELLEKLNTEIQNRGEANETIRTDFEQILEGFAQKNEDGSFSLPLATTLINGIRKLGTDAVISGLFAGVGVTSGGNLVVPVAEDARFGVVKTGGRGVGLLDGVLNLNLRTSYSGFEFEGRSLYINVSEQTVHPVTGNAAKIAFDTAGKLVVMDANAESMGAVYLPESEASKLPSAAASLPVVRKKGNVLSYNYSSVSASSSDAGGFGYLGKLSALGVTGHRADVNTVTLYRRGGETANGNTQVYLRILKKRVDENGTKSWVVCSQSENAIAFASQTQNGGPIGPFFMRRVQGVEPPRTDETIAIVTVSASDASADSCLKYGCKMRTDISGFLANLVISATLNMNIGGAAYAPIIDFTWTSYSSSLAYLESQISTNSSSISELSSRVTLLEEKVSKISFLSLEYSVDQNGGSVSVAFDDEENGVLSARVSESASGYISASVDSTTSAGNINIASI